MLIDYYPKVIRQIQEMREICKAEQPEFDDVNVQADRLLANMFISTADYHGIERMEKELGITPTLGQDIEERRIQVLVRAAKKSLSFKEVLSLMQNYSLEIGLEPDYNREELNVTIGDMVNNVREVYKTLDEISGLNIYIYFTHVSKAVLNVLEPGKEMEFETAIREWMGKGNQLAEAEIKTSINTAETFRDTTLTRQHDLWRLDGSVRLDGSRKLDAEEIKEEI